MRPRTPVMIGILVCAALALAACAPTGGRPSTTIPAAFLASDLGITAAEASTETSGFSLNLTASAEFGPDAGEVTADDLRTMLQLVVENTSLDTVNTLEIYASIGPFDGDNSIDLGALGVELGFDDDNTLSGFSAPWDDVVDFLDE
jgi:hypothetical protein